ncbi:OmpA family protein [Thiothrix litoralis]|uniref:OmpA family protein n=1 Tax=Thiothrix litoralis TaxID=2891210 RepID=A0ABX7WUI1_9GAMM|nr:OmpA family protein [Thiothrix litoralis]QTR44580.1 OmpA family protein [Thiothrix litoralis]
MDKKSACCCGALPAMWWWLLTLLGLPLLFFLMTGARQGVVEKDLATRSQAALKAAGMDWAQVSLDQRGRDVLLNGMAASDQERIAAFKTVQSVYGVRDVQNMVEVAAASASEPAQAAPSKTPEFLLQSVNGKVVLQGVMGSQQEIDEALAAAQGVYGVGKVDNQLQLAEGVAPAAWVKDLAGLLPALQGLENASLKVSAAGNSIGGQAPSNADKASFLDKARALLGEGIVDDLAVKEAAPDQMVKIPEQAPAADAKPEAAAEEQAAANCQQQLNDAMNGKTVLFETNKSGIKLDSAALLDSLVGIVTTCKDVVAGRGIQISGHTDSVGNAAYNQKLSQQRADAVKDYFVNKGVDAGLIKSVGFGASKPVASNANEAGRSQNRRITFDINPE